MFPRKRTSVLVLSLLSALIASTGASAAENQDTTTPPEGALFEPPLYTQKMNPRGAEKVGGPVIRVYKDSNAWFGENRDHNTLLSLGKVLGLDYFIHPLSALSSPIPAGTSVVLLSSNGAGLSSAVSAQNTAAAQDNLEDFIRAGGVLIVDMGDNVLGGGFRAPGAIGTPSRIFPSPCADATLTAAARGLDVTLGTGDDHAIVLGPDGLAGAFDDLDDSNIDMASNCFVAHGNLEDGITLPDEATVLMTARFGGVEKPILAEYCLGKGLVVLDTITKEFRSHRGPSGTGFGPTFFMRNLFGYALGGDATDQCRSHQAFVFQDLDSSVFRSDPSSPPLADDQICGPLGTEVNNIGFRSTDVSIYGVELTRIPSGNKGLVRLDLATCELESLGFPEGLSWSELHQVFRHQRFDAGDVSSDGDTLYLNRAGITALYAVDLTVSPPTAVRIDLRGAKGYVHDWAYNSADGLLYGGDSLHGQLAIVDPGTGIRSDHALIDTGLGELPAGSAYGGAWFNDAGHLILHRNDGQVYEIDLDVPAIVAIGPGRASLYNDGTAPSLDRP